MMQFIYQFDEGMPKISVELHSETTLEEALENFEAFLRACGYSFEGNVTIEEPVNADSTN